MTLQKQSIIERRKRLLSEWSRFKKKNRKAYERLRNNPCFYCGNPPSRDVAKRMVDHVVPWSEGGPHCFSNLVPCCASCNSSKRNWDVESLRCNMALSMGYWYNWPEFRFFGEENRKAFRGLKYRP